MHDRIVITILGNRNSGKSTTWNTLFGSTVRTGRKLRCLYLNEVEYIEVFLVSGSPEERQTYVGDLITQQSPRIVLCSIQYCESVAETIDYFQQQGYVMYNQWLNPGYADPSQQSDPLMLMQRLLSCGALISVRDGKTNPKRRTRELADFLHGWARSRGLILLDT